MNDSILDTIKKMLGLDSDYTAFDTDIITFINAAITTLVQVGIGTKGFTITSSDEEWSDYLEDIENMESVKTYIYLRVRLLFDPPTNATTANSFKEMLSEYEWRLNVLSETEDE